MSQKAQKSFLDTNIFVYTFDGSAPAKKSIAQELVAQALANQRGVISYQVVQEFLNVATRKFTNPMSPVEAELYLTRVLMPLCEIFPDESLYLRAISTSAQAGISFYDSLIVSSALAAKCNVLLTEDLQHGRHIGELEIRDPFR